MINNLIRVLSVTILFFTSIVSTECAADINFDDELAKLNVLLMSNPKEVSSKIASIEANKSQLNSAQYGRLLIFKSIVSLLDADYQNALSSLQLAEKYEINDNQLTANYLYQATAFMGLANYSDALDVIAKNLSRIQQLDELDIKVSSYLRLANLYLDLEAYDEVSRYSTLAMNLSRDHSPKNQCYSMLYVAVAKLKEHQYDSAKTLFHNSHDFCHENKFPLIVSMSKKGIGIGYLEQGQYELAREWLDKALIGYKEFNFDIEINHVNALLAETHLNLNNNDLAEEYAKFVMALPDKKVNLNYKKKSAKVLADLAYTQARYELAFQYLSQHLRISNILLDDTKAKANAYQAAKFENGEKSREINLLNKDRELYSAKAALTESQRNNERMMNTLIFGGLVLLAIFAAVMVIQKRKYKQLAQYDALTGIFNRGTAQNIAENQFIKTASKRGLFSVIMFDLDDFKSINDNYGHGTGDWTLKKVTEVINRVRRRDDVFARFGGEEFALFLPDTDAVIANAMAEEYRQLIQSIDTRFSGHSFNITASFGVSTSCEDDLSLDPLLHRADIAMYYSKSLGRNCVTPYQPEIELSRSGYQNSKMALR